MVSSATTVREVAQHCVADGEVPCVVVDRSCADLGAVVRTLKSAPWFVGCALWHCEWVRREYVMPQAAYSVKRAPFTGATVTFTTRAGRRNLILGDQLSFGEGSVVFRSVFQRRDVVNQHAICLYLNSCDGGFPVQIVRLATSRREATVLRKLSSVPRVPKLVACGEDIRGDRHVIVRQFIAGCRLDQQVYMRMLCKHLAH